jgi:hypothetical protein
MVRSVVPQITWIGVDWEGLNHLDWSGLGGIKSYISQNLTQSLWEERRTNRTGPELDLYPAFTFTIP